MVLPWKPNVEEHDCTDILMKFFFKTFHTADFIIGLQDLG